MRSDALSRRRGDEAITTDPDGVSQVLIGRDVMSCESLLLDPSRAVVNKYINCSRKLRVRCREGRGTHRNRLAANRHTRTERLLRSTIGKQLLLLRPNSRIAMKQ